MKNKNNYLDFRKWSSIASYLKGMAVEALAALFYCLIGLLLTIAAFWLRP